ncbi:H-2 class II histocompatibility antigen, E-S beta chain-like [Zootoca vivipara]|uniref:H-2 class II histocompatibility antigen, E-S beta chain-like n=1 Tax=Zootoca vivipara TaxID=8524 RepID=UPI00293BD0FC|nr:H-2 class II histocompatibility antigen, E-S beta chain-like [Zootoca vivipara]
MTSEEAEKAKRILQIYRERRVPCLATDDASSARRRIGRSRGGEVEWAGLGQDFSPGLSGESPISGAKKRERRMGGSGAAPLDFWGLLLRVGVLVVSASEGLRVEEPPEHFLSQKKAECHFSNGTQQIRYLDRYFFDRQEFAYFDSDRGKFVAVDELGKPDVERANKDKDHLRTEMSNLDVYCRRNYRIYEPFSQNRHVQPKVKITPTNNEESSPHNTLLICTAGRFFPAGIEIKWFRNGKEEPKVWTTGLTRNGDWTFNFDLELETTPERGDVYTCQVEHASFEGPVTVQWEPQSDSARSKMWTGIVGIVLGLVFGATGLALYLKNKKGQAVPQPAGLIS